MTSKRASTMRILTIAGLAAVVLGASGVLAAVDYGDFYPNDEGYPETPYKDGNLSVADVRSIVDEIVSSAKDQFVEAAASYTLNHPEVESIVLKYYNEARKKERKCKEKNYTYWDPDIPACRSCLRDVCDHDDTCRRECRDILKVRRLEEEAVDAKEKNEILNSQVIALRSWLIVLAAVVLCVIVAGLAVSIVAFNQIKNVRETKPKIPESDKESGKMPTEEQGFLNDSGNVSEATV